MTSEKPYLGGGSIGVVICSLLLSVPLFVIAGVYWGDECQDDENFHLRLDQWLVVMACINILSSLLAIPGRCFAAHIIGLCMYCGWALMFLIVFVSWNIIGSITLFSHSGECIKNDSDGKGLWILTLIVLIGHWIFSIPFILGQFTGTLFAILKKAFIK